MDLEVKYNPQSIDNIFSMSIVTSKYRLTMDSLVEDAILIHLQNDQEIKFTCCGHGLYYFDTANTIHVEMSKYNIIDNETIDKYKISATGYSFFSTVSINKKIFAQRKIEVVDNAWLLQGRIGWLSYQYYNRCLLSNLINNCNPTVDNINIVAAIYGPFIPILQGKTTQRRPQHSAQFTRIFIPSPVVQTPNIQHQHQCIICRGTLIPNNEVLCLTIPWSQLLQRTGHDIDQLCHQIIHQYIWHQRYRHHVRPRRQWIRESEVYSKINPL